MNGERKRKRVHVRPGCIPETGGVYVLVLRLGRVLRTRVGRLGLVEFAPGYYCYAGSARRGLRSRLGRHLRRSGKALHWHVDYLRRRTALAGVACWPGVEGECAVAKALKALEGLPMPGFGCSDCACGTHLYYFPEPPLGRLRELAVAGRNPLLLP